MSARKHVLMMAAALALLGVAISVALRAQAPADRPAPAESAEPRKEAPMSDATQPQTTAAQTTEPSQASDLADGSTASDSPAEASDANADTSPTREELQRQATAAIPHVERPTIDPHTEYEPGVVLVSVRKGTTADQLAQAMAEAGIRSVEHDDVEYVTDGLVKAKLAPDASIDDAIYELESTGVARGAQPNYVYETMEEEAPVLDGADSADEDAPAQDEAADTDATKQDEAAPTDDASATTTPDEPAPTVKADEAEEQPDTPSTIDTQASSPTAARDALNDADASKQWNLDSIDALDAWEFPPLKNATTTVGVGILDNGFNNLHEDLADNVQSTYNATTGESAPVRCPDNTPNIEHGSHIAGIVAATANNEKGIGGVGLNHLKLSLVCLTQESDPSGISTDDVVKGFDYLIQHKEQYNIRVANMSLGAKVDSLPADDAILNKVDETYGAGIVITASAGNKTGTAIPPYINYPSDYETMVSVINLRNTNSDDPKSVKIGENSNFNAPGETSKNISAPGTDIYSTYRTGYGEMSGTSMAAPHAASVLGLMFAVNPMLSASQAKSLLFSSARDIGDEGWDETYGYGEVNAFTAVRAAAEGTMAGPEYLAVGSKATYTLGTSYAGWSFSSSNSDVLTIDEAGSATAVSAGVAIVRASNGTSAITQQVTVLGPITGNTLVAKDGSEALTIDTPDGCGSLSWSWSSSDESVATVTDNGVVYGHGEGSATITASLVSDPSVSLSSPVTVYDAREGDVYVPVGDTATLEPHMPADAESATVSWSSTNEQVATVDATGKVSAVRAGGSVVSCLIRQGDTSVTNVWCVYVYGPIEGDARVGVNQSTQLAVTGIRSMPQEAQVGWTWSLDAGSDSAVATVSESGEVTGHALGTVRVTATKGAGQDQVSFAHEVTVTTASLADARVTIPKQTYTGEKLTPIPTVTLNGTTLVAGTDYEVVDQDIVDAGSHTVTMEGRGLYGDKATGSFVVEPMQLTPPKATVRFLYDGSSHTAIPEGATYTLRGDINKTDADEYLTIATVKDGVNTCWTNGSTIYRIEWIIEPRPASELSISGLSPCVYNGKKHTPKPTVTWNSKELNADEDEYTVSYAHNVNAGTATVTITCEEGNFIGTQTATFRIAPAPYSVGTVTAAVVKDSLNPADVVLKRSDTSRPGRLALKETKLSCGTNTYHWTFTPKDANYASSSGTVKITATKHAWGKPTYTWAKGDSSCTAKRVCSNNSKHVEEETVTPVRKVTTKPTTEHTGKATLTATFRNGAFKTQSKEITLPKLSKTSQAEAAKSSTATQPTYTSSASNSTSTSDAYKLPATSDSAQPVAPIAIAGMVVLGLGMAIRATKPSWR